MFDVATVPDSPQSLSAQFGNGEALLSFQPGTFDGGSEVLIYSVRSEPFVNVWNVTANSSLSSYEVILSNLTNGVSYTFNVSATNDVGESDTSSNSNEVVPGAYEQPTFGLVCVMPSSCAEPGSWNVVISVSVSISFGGQRHIVA